LQVEADQSPLGGTSGHACHLARADEVMRGVGDALVGGIGSPVDAEWR
jgi:hypothetical protein